MDKIKLDLTLLLPSIKNTDHCVNLLPDWLATIKGIEQAHITQTEQEHKAQLCLHYDPDLLPLSRVERLAYEAGVKISQRYRHEQIALKRMGTAESAAKISNLLEKLPGMLHAQVNYAAGLAFVAYDSTILQADTIEQTLRKSGIIPISPSPQNDKSKPEEESHTHDEQGHGSAPVFLPHWLQEKWTLILVGLTGLFLVIGWFGEQILGWSHSISLLFFILAYLTGGYDISRHAIPGLFKGKFDTDVLMLAAAAGAAILGEWSEGAFLLFLFSLGHAGEHYALDRARNAVNALGELMPKTAHVKRGEQIVEDDVENIHVGEIVIVRPGDRLPVDGNIISGQSTIDQSSITGESMPIEKKVGDDVFAGTINQDTALEVEVTRLAKDNTLSRVMQLVAEAQSQQSPTQAFTQRFMAWFVPTVLIVVLLVIIVPPLLGWLTFSQSFYRAMLLLVGASPCALALGTPATVLAGIAQAARNGVLIKGGSHLENLGILKVIAFDKTGTLTEGKFSVTDVIPLNEHSVDEVLSIAASVEQQSNHPLALAVVRAAQAKKLSLPEASNLENIAGRGVKSKVNGKTVFIGSLKLFSTSSNFSVPLPDPTITKIITDLEADGKTIMIVNHADEFLGVLALADTPRPKVKTIMNYLLNLGIEQLIMLTGDNNKVARRVGDVVGMTTVKADLLPEDKLKAIKDLQSQHGAVAMIGDGVNDAPALATATVGIAMGGAGTAVALETADVALMGDDLSKIPFAVGLSRASRAIIRQNLAIALGVICLLIISSVFGWVQLGAAVVLHEGSTIVVVFNALRLLGYKGNF